MKRRATRFSLLLVLIFLLSFSSFRSAAAEPGIIPPGFDGIEYRVILLLPHPQKNVLEDIVNLVDKEMLSVSSLHIIGIYHEKETEDYSGARKYIEENNIDWIEIREIKCKLGKKESRHNTKRRCAGNRTRTGIPRRQGCALCH